jgi:hypothetical protein
VLAWRLEKLIEKAPEILANAGERPVQGLTDTQLANLRREAEEAARANAQTFAEAATLEGPQPACHWTSRRHGRLTDAELEHRIFTSRVAFREQESINDPAAARRGHHQLLALQDEQRIRARQFNETRLGAETSEGNSRTQSGTDAPGVTAGYQRAENTPSSPHGPAPKSASAPSPPAPSRPPKLLTGCRNGSPPPGQRPAATCPHHGGKSSQHAGRYSPPGSTNEATFWRPSRRRGPRSSGRVPGRPDAAQQWRDTAAEIELFRARYNVPETEATPVPERFREEDIGRQLHEQAVTVNKRSRALPDHASEQDRALDALHTVERTKATHAPEIHGQEPTAVTPAQVEKPRLMTRLQKMVAEQQARKAAEQKPAEQKAPETDAQRHARMAAERSVREQQRADQSRGDDLGY